MVSAPLEQVIRDVLGPDAAASLATPRGMSLWGSLGVEAFLRGDGAVWVETYRLDAPEEVERREVAGLERLTNLVIAAERRPQLVALLPVRTDASRSCTGCGGERSLPLSPDTQRPGVYLRTGAPWRVWCGTCGGLGFIG